MQALVGKTQTLVVKLDSFRYTRTLLLCNSIVYDKKKKVILMTIQFFGYPKCSTCRKASKWLKDHQVEFEDNHIVENPPSKEMIKEILVNTNTDIKKLFNTSGTKYREMQLKDKLPNMTEKEQIETLVSDGMLIKRPIVYDGEHLTLGFKEEEFEHIWKSV